jgi:hypothetical protein
VKTILSKVLKGITYDGEKFKNKNKIKTAIIEISIISFDDSESEIDESVIKSKNVLKFSPKIEEI